MRRLKLPWQVLWNVRHGRSLANVHQSKTGSFHESEETRAPIKGVSDPNIPLIELGVRQSRQAGINFRKEFGVPDVVICSGYRRTRDTLSHMLEAYTPEERARIEIIDDPLLREREPGFVQGTLQSEVDLWFPWHDDDWKKNGPFYATPPGGESMAQVLDRATTFFLKYRDEFVGARVLHPAHGRIMQATQMLLEGWSVERMIDHMTHNKAPRNCSLVEYKNRGDGLVFERYEPHFCGISV